MNQKELLIIIKKYFEEEIFLVHKNNSLHKNTKLNSYKINPIIVKYLSKVLEDDFTSKGIAKALYYPRVLGTSINTSFGSKIQKMFVKLNLATGSGYDGMDIEFTDQTSNMKLYCQLKAGPNTINSGDVKPILNKFEKLARRTSANNSPINNNQLVLGLLYGNINECSAHYNRINESYPVYIGNDFWHRITGYKTFYTKLIKELDSLIKDLDMKKFLNEGCNKLEQEIKKSDLFNF